MAQLDKCLMCEGTDTSGTGICDWCWIVMTIDKERNTHKEEH